MKQLLKGFLLFIILSIILSLIMMYEGYKYGGEILFTYIIFSIIVIAFIILYIKLHKKR